MPAVFEGVKGNLQNHGAGRDRETEQLIARLIGGKTPPIALASDLLETFGGLRDLARAEVHELECVPGIGPVRAARVRAGLALGRKLAGAGRPERLPIRASRDVFQLVHQDLRDLEQEVFEILLLDARNRLFRRERVSVGTATGSLVHPREVFRPAIRHSAVSLVMLHNHPSGDPSPSPEDRDVTRRIAAAGEILGIRVLDHIVVGEGRYISFADEGLLAAGF